MSKKEITILIILYSLVIFASAMTLFGNHNTDTSHIIPSEDAVIFKD